MVVEVAVDGGGGGYGLVMEVQWCRWCSVGGSGLVVVVGWAGRGWGEGDDGGDGVAVVAVVGDLAIVVAIVLSIFREDVYVGRYCALCGCCREVVVV